MPREDAARHHGPSPVALGIASCRTRCWSFASSPGSCSVLEALGGPLLVVGLFTRPTAFILSGEMAVTGYLELVAGPLLLAGAFVRPAAWAIGVEAVLAYLAIAQPRAPWPIRNGGIEALLYAAVMLYFVVAGPGPWTAGALFRTPASHRSAPAAAGPPR